MPPTKRQLKPEVLSAAIEASSLPRKADTGCSRRIGNLAPQSVRNTASTLGASRFATTTRPTRGFPSNPQWETETVRSCDGPTGQPVR